MYRFFLFLATHMFLHITQVTCFRVIAAVGRRAVLANTLCFTFIVFMLMFSGLIIPPSEYPTPGCCMASAHPAALYQSMGPSQSFLVSLRSCPSRSTCAPCWAMSARSIILELCLRACLCGPCL